MEKIKILFVDDDKNLCSTMKSLLSKNGFETTAAFSANEAYKYLEKQKPDIIISDIIMPDIDGFEFCKSIKEKERYADIEFIFLTALNNRDDEIKGLDMGADDYITKPFSYETLLARIKTKIRKIKKTRKENILRGDLSQWSITDILQVIEMGEKKGRLIIYTDRNDTVWLDVNKGNIIEARFNRYSGNKALQKILNITKGTFLFDPERSVAAHGGKRILSLLLSAATDLDEKKEYDKRREIISALKRKIWD